MPTTLDQNRSIRHPPRRRLSRSPSSWSSHRARSTSRSKTTTTARRAGRDSRSKCSRWSPTRPPRSSPSRLPVAETMPRVSMHSLTHRTVSIRHAVALKSLLFRKASTLTNPHISNHRLYKIHSREILMQLHRKRTTIREWIHRNHPVKSMLEASSDHCQHRNSRLQMIDPPCNIVTTFLHWWNKVTLSGQLLGNIWEAALSLPAPRRLGTISSKWTMQGHSRIRDWALTSLRSSSSHDPRLAMGLVRMINSKIQI